jgi:hypothetical protein
MMKHQKTSKGLTAVKQYFLKGKLPDWEKFAEWGDYQGHVDLFVLLWLHPSWDRGLLTTLRDEYIASDKVIYRDVSIGFTGFLNAGTVFASQDYTGDSEIPFPYTDGHNELLFDIIMGDLSKTQYNLGRFGTFIKGQPVYDVPRSELFAILEMSHWLFIREMKPINNDMLFQYDRPLEWWYQSCEKDENYFSKQAQESVYRSLIEKSLYRIYHFDTQAEGDTCRTRFVYKMRKILDEREFISEFKTMWEEVKSGKIQVENPWKI